MRAVAVARMRQQEAAAAAVARAAAAAARAEAQGRWLRDCCRGLVLPVLLPSSPSEAPRAGRPRAGRRSAARLALAATFRALTAALWGEQQWGSRVVLQVPCARVVLCCCCCWWWMTRLVVWSRARSCAGGGLTRATMVARAAARPLSRRRSRPLAHAAAAATARLKSCPSRAQQPLLFTCTRRPLVDHSHTHPSDRQAHRVSAHRFPYVARAREPCSQPPAPAALDLVLSRAAPPDRASANPDCSSSRRASTHNSSDRRPFF